MFITNTISCFPKSVELRINYKDVNFTGKTVQALAINDQIPAPILRFKEGEFVELIVYNEMNEPTAVHWHGLILPWKMDGVAYVTQQPILPKEKFIYKFKLNQSGTYWYHAHFNLQEQRGLYGAFIIEPQNNPVKVDRDYPIVLSDWIDTTPGQVFLNLKKDGDYYVSKFPMQPSLARFINDYNKSAQVERNILMMSYKMMQTMRMSVYDLSDVAYDEFLINGKSTKSPWFGKIKKGEIVRLRFINAGASTIFKIKIENEDMKIIHVQGNDVQPYIVSSLSIAPGETYDVLIKIVKNEPYIIYAESNDSLGSIYGILANENTNAIPSIEKFPLPKPVSMGHNSVSHEDHSMKPTNSNHAMSKHNSMQYQHIKKNVSKKSMDNMTVLNTSKYRNVKAVRKTNNPNKNFTTIKMDLTGFMHSYRWFINGVPEYLSKPYMIEKNKRYRLIFNNTTMMHHPMHLHGHWMILRNGNGAYDPLLHTIDVSPGENVIADFDADANGGQWIFHCHNLYHMKAGMAAIFRYVPNSINTNPYENLNGHPNNHWYLVNNLELGILPYKDEYEGTLETLFGYDENKLQIFIEDFTIDKKGKIENFNMDLFYWRPLHQFWSVKGGINYVYKPSKNPYIQAGVGIEGIMPYFLEVNARSYLHKNSVKLDFELSRDTQIFNNSLIATSVRSIIASKIVQADEIGQGLNTIQISIKPYQRISTNLNLYIEYEYTRHYYKLKKILTQNNQDISEHALIVGLSILF
ncbi:MAG: multicopper oxidase domain-containing protein [Legionellales bacterium]|nr:multicopper oxidase domain-containing protein [Legionellales bacterium]